MKMSYSTEEASISVAVLAIVIFIVFLGSAVLFSKQRRCMRELYKLYPLFSTLLACYMVVIFGASVLSVVINICIITFISVIYASNGKRMDKSITKEELSGRIYISFRIENQYDRNVQLMDEDEKKVWYEQYCRDNPIPKPIYPAIITTIPLLIIMLVYMNAYDYPGFFTVVVYY